MPSDFGDESGEKMFDWMMRIGEDAGIEAMRAAATGLATALENARGGIAPAKPGSDEPSGWARLSMAEFEALPEYATVREAIGAKLHAEAIEHSFATVSGRDYLVFRIEDAPALSAAFGEMRRGADEALGRAARAVESRCLARDVEPLEKRAAAAREGAKAIEAAKSHVRELSATVRSTP